MTVTFPEPSTDEAAVAIFPRALFEELDPALQKQLAAVVERVGYFGEFFAVVGQNSGALTHFLEYTKAVKGVLPDRLNELLALRVSSLLGADYERIQHERLAQKLGLARPWIKEVVDGARTEPSQLTSVEALLLRLVEAVLDRDSKHCACLLHDTRQALGDEQTLAAVLQIARFQMIACLIRTFRLELPVRSIFV
jgi:alkylhydroperoxidase family enzyme